MRINETISFQPVTSCLILYGCSNGQITDLDIMNPIWNQGEEGERLRLIDKVSSSELGLTQLTLANFRRFGQEWYSAELPRRRERIGGYVSLVRACESWILRKMPRLGGLECFGCSRRYRNHNGFIKYHHYGIPVDWRRGIYAVALLCTHIGDGNPLFYFACDCLQKSQNKYMTSFDYLPIDKNENTICRLCRRNWTVDELIKKSPLKCGLPNNAVNWILPLNNVTDS